MEHLHLLFDTRVMLIQTWPCVALRIIADISNMEWVTDTFDNNNVMQCSLPVHKT